VYQPYHILILLTAKWWRYPRTLYQVESSLLNASFGHLLYLSCIWSRDHHDFRGYLNSNHHWRACPAHSLYLPVSPRSFHPGVSGAQRGASRTIPRIYPSHLSASWNALSSCFIWFNDFLAEFSESSSGLTQVDSCGKISKSSYSRSFVWYPSWLVGLYRSDLM